MVRIGKLKRQKSEISREDDSDAMSDFSSSQFTFNVNQNIDGINQNMEYMKEDSFRQSGSSSRLFFCFPKCGPRYIKYAIQFLFLLSSTAMIFIIVFFVSIAVMDNIFKNRVISTSENSNINSVPNVPIVFRTLEPTTTPTLQKTSLPTPSIQNDIQSPVFQTSFQPSMSKSSTPSNEQIIIAPSVSPSFSPSLLISNEPSDLITSVPSTSPSTTSSHRPSVYPSSIPTVLSTSFPSNRPHALFSNKPSVNNSSLPTTPLTTEPTELLTSSPSTTSLTIPSNKPSFRHSSTPTLLFSTRPSASRVSSKISTFHPTITESSSPTHERSNKPTLNPTEPFPSPKPSITPTKSPTEFPTKVLTKTVFTMTSGYIDEKDLEDELMNQPDDSEFIVHLGNFLNVDKGCNPSTYMDYRDMLLSSAIPIFMIPGTNDLNSDCVAVNNDDATNLKPIESWETYFHEVNSYWVNSFIYVQHSLTTHALFAIFQNDVLFIGLNLLREPRWGDPRYATQLNMNLRWIKRQLEEKVVQERGLKSLVLFGNDPISESNRLFFEDIVNEIDSMDIPAIYFYESESIESSYPVGNELLFVGVESSYVPFMSVVVRTDGAQFAFQIIMR